MPKKRNVPRSAGNSGEKILGAASSIGRPSDVQQSAEHALSPGLRWLLSVLVVVQLIAVVAEPFRFFTRSSRGTSPAADPARSLLAPWIEFGYLNHGYFFFAPEPGPSHLIECRLQLADGQQATVRFPDRQAQWPRLLYHRHFMLTENLHQLWAPPITPALAAGADPLLLRDWQADRSRFESVRDSLAEHVAHRFQAEAVELDRIEHRLPSDEEVFRQRMRLDDRRLYMTLPDAPLADDELPPGNFNLPPPPLLLPADRRGQDNDREPAPTLLPPQREELP